MQHNPQSKQPDRYSSVCFCVCESVSIFWLLLTLSNVKWQHFNPVIFLFSSILKCYWGPCLCQEWKFS